jgi:hypothetical protein
MHFFNVLEKNAAVLPPSSQQRCGSDGSSATMDIRVINDCKS